MSVVIENPEIKISEIEILPAEEKKQILETFNHPADEYPGKSTADLLQEQVDRTPQGIPVLITGIIQPLKV